MTRSVNVSRVFSRDSRHGDDGAEPVARRVLGLSVPVGRSGVRSTGVTASTPSVWRKSGCARFCTRPRAELQAQARTGGTFAEEAAEWLRCVEVDRQRKPSTLAGYDWIVSGQLVPAFRELPVEAVATEVMERWLALRQRLAEWRGGAYGLVADGGVCARAEGGLVTRPVTRRRLIALRVPAPPFGRSGAS